METRKVNKAFRWVLVIIISLELYLLLSMASQATPITDDYCLAYSGRNFGVISSFLSFNQLWTPSITYLPMLAFWSIPGSGTLLARSVCLFTFIFACSSIYIFGNSLFSERIYAIRNFIRNSILMIGLFSVFAIVQSSILFRVASSQNRNLLYILKEWLQNFFFQARDGQMLIWVFASPVTASKTIINCLILFSIILAVKIANLDNLKFNAIVSILFFSSFLLGLSTEPLVIITFASLLILFRFFKNANYRKSSLIPITVAMLSVYGMLISPGTEKRQVVLTNRGISEHVLMGLGITSQITFMLICCLLCAGISALLICLTHDAKYLQNLEMYRIYSGFLLLANILVNVVVESFVYPSVYHWMGLLFSGYIFFFLFFYSILLSKRDLILRLQLWNPLRYLLVIFILIPLLITFDTMSTVSQRNMLIHERMYNSKLAGTNLLVEVPPRDNLGWKYIGDIGSDSPSIVPGIGYIKSASSFCYVRLPVGW